MKKRQFTAKFKTKVILEALKEVSSVSDLENFNQEHILLS
jgi:hypothetical protein